MNLKADLQKMNLSDLKFICKELGVSYKGYKSNIIKKLLEPLKQTYRMKTLRDLSLQKINIKSVEDFENIRDKPPVIFEMILNRQNKYGTTPLMKSAYNGNIELTRALLNSGAKVNIEDNTGSNALRYASQEGHTNVVKLLLENGADFNKKDKMNATPLHHAVLYGYKDIVELLLNAGADVNIPPKTEKHSTVMLAGATKKRPDAIGE